MGGRVPRERQIKHTYKKKVCARMPVKRDRISGFTVYLCHSTVLNDRNQEITA